MKDITKKLDKKIVLSVAAAVTALAGIGIYSLSQLGDNNQTSATMASQNNSQNASRFAVTNRLIQSLEEQIQREASKTTADTQLKLANAYLQKVRETADTSYYAKVDSALAAAAALESGNPEVFAIRAAVAYGRHDFTEGLKSAQRAAKLKPKQASYHGLVGDGQIELGNYPAAVAAYQIMVDLRPNLSSFNRIAHIREIYGDIEGAKAALASAISAGSNFPENVAFSQVELGKLQLRGSYPQNVVQNSDKAETSFKQALASVQDFEPALQGLGKVAAARGNNKLAISYFQKAAKALPVAQYATDLGDIYAVQSDSRRSAQQYQLARLAYQQSEADGIDTDQELALFLADHSRDYDAALSKAKAAYRVRPNIYAADTLAWAHHKKGNAADAKRYSAEALRLGEHDPTILFHAGMISQKAGNTAEAKRLLTRALELHPNFSIIHVPVAKKVLAES